MFPPLRISTRRNFQKERVCFMVLVDNFGDSYMVSVDVNKRTYGAGFSNAFAFKVMADVIGEDACSLVTVAWFKGGVVHFDFDG